MAPQLGSILMVFGEPGVGKSYRRCAQMVPEILWDGASRHVSNFPIRREDSEHGEGMISAISRIVGIEREEAERRLVTMDLDDRRAILSSWEPSEAYSTKPGSGPWDLWKDEDLSGCHIAIDEIQKYCPERGCPSAHKKAWIEWLSEIRHRGARIEFVTQDKALVAREIIALAETQVKIVKRDAEMIPWLGVHFLALRQFWCKLLGKKLIFCYEVYEKKSEGKFAENSRESFVIDGSLYSRYNSHSKPVTGVAGKEQDEAWERYSWPGLLWWFWRMYWVRHSINVCCVAFVVWFLFFGGINLAGAFVVHEAKSIVAGLTKQAPINADGQVGADDATPAPRPLVHVPAAQPAERPAETQPSGEAVVVVAITPKGAYFQGLGFVRVGEQLEEGEQDGVRLESVDWFRSRVLLSDDRVYRLAVGRTPSDGAIPADVRNPPSPAGQAGFGGADSGGSDVNGGRYPPGRVGEDVSEGSRVEPRHQQRIRGQGGVDRREGRATNRVPSDRGSQAGDTGQLARPRSLLGYTSTGGQGGVSASGVSSYPGSNPVDGSDD